MSHSCTVSMFCQKCFHQNHSVLKAWTIETIHSSYNCCRLFPFVCYSLALALLLAFTVKYVSIFNNHVFSHFVHWQDFATCLDAVYYLIWNWKSMEIHRESSFTSLFKSISIWFVSIESNKMYVNFWPYDKALSQPLRKILGDDVVSRSESRVPGALSRIYHVESLLPRVDDDSSGRNHTKKYP